MTDKSGIEIVRGWCDANHPEIALVMGSGLAFPPEGVDAEITEVPYGDLPGFSKPGVEGHKGVLRMVTFSGKSVLVFAGRRHFYEGCTYQEIVRGVVFAHELGITKILLTNSAGGLNKSLSVGDLVLLNDFIIPFDIGMPGGFSPKERKLRRVAGAFEIALLKAAEADGDALTLGTYAFMPGPAYETPAEVEMLKRWGADVVGMSTAPEWWEAIRLGMEVTGLSLVTNVHSRDAAPPSHSEVLGAAASGGKKMAGVIHRAILAMG